MPRLAPARRRGCEPRFPRGRKQTDEKRQRLAAKFDPCGTDAARFGPRADSGPLGIRDPSLCVANRRSRHACGPCKLTLLEARYFACFPKPICERPRRDGRSRGCSSASPHALRLPQGAARNLPPTIDLACSTDFVIRQPSKQCASGDTGGFTVLVECQQIGMIQARHAQRLALAVRGRKMTSMVAWCHGRVSCDDGESLPIHQRVRDGWPRNHARSRARRASECLPSPSPNWLGTRCRSMRLTY